MFKIIRDLVRNSEKRPFYFHGDSLWINPGARRFCCQTHDVYHGKGVNTKMQKNGPLVSRGYREEKSENCAPWCSEPTMCMSAKALSVFGRKTSRSYLVENKLGSVLAPQHSGRRTHDVYEAARLSPAMALFRPPHFEMFSSLRLASISS